MATLVDEQVPAVIASLSEPARIRACGCLAAGRLAHRTFDESHFARWRPPAGGDSRSRLGSASATAVDING
ncbi:hypothetical protein [Micromonospora eburnea]|uniref:hypothetical protein n=1 Tax=Micromonospora eburnea TaxID=227316 RepID=UPI00114CE4DA|nr:hypothetical protein [Micromonospora eburnea]